MRRAAKTLALAAWLAAAAPACYAPDVVSGSLRCGAGGSCPEGYSCLDADKTCWKNGEVPATAPLGGNLTSFTGHWPFTMQATVKINCTDGSHDMKTLEDDWVDIAEGVNGDISLSYYCDWDLNVASNGKSATLVPGTTCMTVMPMQGTNKVATTYTWTASSFTFAMTGGASAVLHAGLTGNYIKALTCVTPTSCAPCATNCTGMCMSEISGPLTKTTN